MDYVRWKPGIVERRYVGMTTSAAVAGVKRSSETVFINADALPLPKQFSSYYAVFPWKVEAGPTRG